MKLSPENLNSADLEGSPIYKRLFQAVEGKKFNKPHQNLKFTGNRDTDFIILQSLEDKDLPQFCAVNSYVNDLCKDDLFWKRRFFLRYGNLLGKETDIIEDYKPINVSWKDYYIWLNSAVDGDLFFVYIHADAIGRVDVLKVLEYNYPEIFSDMDEVYILSEEFKQKLNNSNLILSNAMIKAYGLPEWMRHISFGASFSSDFHTKRTLMYILASLALEPQSRVLGKEKRYEYSLTLMEEIKLDPLTLLENMLKQMTPYHGPDINNVKIYLLQMLGILRNHFLEIGINADRSVYMQKLERKIKTFGIGATTALVIGGVLLSLYSVLSRK